MSTSLDTAAVAAVLALFGTIIASFIASARAWRAAREAVAGLHSNALARDAEREDRARRVAECLERDHVEYPREPTRRTFLRLQAGQAVRWQTEAPYSDARLLDLLFGAARGNLDAVVINRIQVNDIIFLGANPFHGMVVPRLASWFLPGHPARPVLTDHLFSPTDRIVVELVTLDDVDLCIFVRWGKTERPWEDGLPGPLTAAVQARLAEEPPESGTP